MTERRRRKKRGSAMCAVLFSDMHTFLKQHVSLKLSRTVMKSQIQYNKPTGGRLNTVAKILRFETCLLQRSLQHVSTTQKTTTQYKRSTKSLSNTVKLSVWDSIGHVSHLSEDLNCFANSFRSCSVWRNMEMIFPAVYLPVVASKSKSKTTKYVLRNSATAMLSIELTQMLTYCETG